MNAGKAASQASHAAVQASLACIESNPERFKEYQGGAFGTKVCLLCENESRLLDLKSIAESRGIPHALIEDSGHLSFFQGKPTITALGIGPIMRGEMTELRKLPLMT